MKKLFILTTNFKDYYFWIDIKGYRKALISERKKRYENMLHKK